jgi:hypothetical protein
VLVYAGEPLPFSIAGADWATGAWRGQGR